MQKLNASVIPNKKCNSFYSVQIFLHSMTVDIITFGKKKKKKRSSESGYNNTFLW